MPNYDYFCDSCGYTFEIFQKMSDSPLTECPKCKKKVRKLLSAGLGISFKGNGFYVNDSEAKKTKNTIEGTATPPKLCDGNCKACS